MARPEAIDVLVGRNIRLCRICRRIDAAQFAASIGADVDVVEQYENGAVRVGAGRLMRIARALDVEVGVLFCGGSDELRGQLRDTSYRPADRMHRDAPSLH